MKRGHKRVISFITTALLISSTVFAYPLSIKASTSKSGIDNETKISIVKSLFAKEAKMSGIKGKLNYTNDNSSKTNTTSLNPDDDVRLIVQLNEKCVKDYLPGVQLSKAGFSSSLKQTVLNSQGTVKTQVLRLSKNIKIRDTYYLLLNGFSVQAKARDISKIENLPGVKHVTVCRQFYPDMNYSKNLTNVPEVWNDTNLKYKGEGQVVAIIDTGIDMNHKDMKITDTSKEKLKPEEGFNDKVPYGYNFADNNTEVKAAPGTSEHGMHVAGIVAANGSDSEIASNKAVKGNAPEAQLLAMKVFTNNPNFESAFSDDIIAAIEDSVAHKADVINMSLGSAEAFQDTESAEQIAVKNANDSGTVCCISAGNSQYSLAPYKFGDLMDDGTVGSPGLAEASLCVASYENTNITSYGIDYSSSNGQGSNPLLYTMCNVNPLDTLKDTTNGYELVYAGLGTSDDFAKAGDLTGKIALVQRGSNTFVEKQENAQAANAIGIIVFDKDSNVNQPLSNMASDPSVTIPALFISTTDGYTLKNLIAKNLKVYFKGSVSTIANSASGDMSDFTSWGPTPNLEIKPEVSAPGGNIWSTVNNDRYESMSGTSMASPHTAGIVALVSQRMADFQKNNNVTLTSQDKANLEKALVINTAVPKLDPATKGKTYTYFSPRRQGAGLIDAYAAVKNNVTIKGEDGKSVIALKELDTASKQFKLTFHNYGTKDVTYNCTDLSGVMQEQNKPVLTTMSYDMPISGSYVTFSQPTITVPAGKDAEMTVTLSLPGTQTNNYVEGYLSFVDPTDTVPTIGTTYMGYYGKWDASSIVDAPVWDTDNTYLGITSLFTEDSGDIAYLGIDGYDKDGNIITNPDNIAFSTNEKALNNNVIPGLSFLRNSKSSTFEVLDSKYNVVRTLNVTENIRKDTLSEDTPARFMQDWEWDGKVYDTATNSYVAAKDGQYYIKVISSIDYPNAEPQSIVMPVKLDSVAPKISDISYSDGKVSFKAADDNSGFVKIAYFVDDAEEPVILSVYANRDGNALSYDKATGLYSFNLDAPLSIGQHEIDIFGLDNAGNIGADYYTPTVVGSKMEISVDSKYATGSMFNTDKINFTGSLTELPAEFKVMGNDAMQYFDKKTLEFNVPVTLIEGLNKVSVYAKGTSDTDYQNYSVNIYSDTVAPTITLNLPDIPKETLDSNSITINTDADTYKIAGTVKDDLFGYKLALNGEVLANVSLEVPDENATLRTFEKTVSLVQGTNKFVLEADDLAGNMTTKTIIINSTTVPNNNISVDLDSKTIQDNERTNVNKITIAGKVSEKPVSFKINGNNVTVNDDLTFTYDLSLVQGANTVEIAAAGSKGDTDIFNKKLTVYCDTTAPKLTLENFEDNNPTEMVNTDTLNYTISGAVEDEYFGYDVDINGVPVTSNTISNPTGVKGTFSYVCPLNYGMNVFVVKATDTFGNATVRTITVNTAGYKRLGGDTRVDTAIKISQDGWRYSAYAVLVSGNNFPDGIVAGPLAKAYNAPILMTRATADAPALENSVMNELIRLNVKHVIIIGGNGVIPAKVEDRLNSANIDCDRIGGQNRYETCAKVANYMLTKKFTTGKAVVVVNANAFADAMSISAYASEKAYPILLTDNNSISKSISDFMKNAGTAASLAIGGKGVISDAVVNSLPKCTRISGNDRYETNAQVLASLATDKQLNTIYIATGEGFADALTASALAAKNNSQILLVGPKPADITKQYVQSKASVIKNYVVIGGTGVVDNNIISLLLNK